MVGKDKKSSKKRCGGKDHKKHPKKGQTQPKLKEAKDKDKKGQRTDRTSPKPNEIILWQCAEKGCGQWSSVLVKDRLGGRLPACVHHRCADEDCWRLRVDGSAWCAKHTCGIALCTNRCPKRQMDCGTHLPCSVEGCVQVQRLGDDGRARPYCSDHLCEYSIKSHWNCNLRKERDRKFCRHHQCNSVNGCPQVALRGPFCEDHLCRARVDGSRCQLGAERDGYCGRHSRERICKYVHCDRPGDHVGTTLTGAVFYCADHNEELCPGFGRADLPYCGIHVVDSLPYCEAHRCQAPGCVKVKDVNIRIAWCEDHMCSSSGCEERRRDGGSLCSGHNV